MLRGALLSDSSSERKSPLINHFSGWIEVACASILIQILVVKSYQLRCSMQLRRGDCERMHFTKQVVRRRWALGGVREGGKEGRRGRICSHSLSERRATFALLPVGKGLQATRAKYKTKWIWDVYYGASVWVVALKFLSFARIHWQQ